MQQYECIICHRKFQTYPSQRRFLSVTCSHKCRGALKTLNRRPVKERFFENINTNGPIPAHRPELGQCWIWTGCLDRQGYGITYRSPKERLVRSHRMSWEIHCGLIPNGINVLHKCDNPSCIRPTHLFLGDQKANIQDALSKGRLARGERHYMAKLTDSEVIQIKYH
jgi:hypothetical protein